MPRPRFARLSRAIVQVTTLALALPASCRGAPDLFAVVHSNPADGDSAAPQTQVRITFSAPYDHTTCDDAFALSAVGPDGNVVWDVPLTVQAGSDPDTVTLAHDPLVPGVDHALTVETGDHGCISSAGDALQPFAAVFSVVAP